MMSADLTTLMPVDARFAPGMESWKTCDVRCDHYAEIGDNTFGLKLSSKKGSRACPAQSYAFAVARDHVRLVPSSRLAIVDGLEVELHFAHVAFDSSFDLG